MRKIFTSVDLGSDSIKIMVGEIFNKKLNVLATSCFKSRGIKKGLIVNASEVIGSLKAAIGEMEKKIGVTIDKVIASVPSYYSSFEIVNAEIDVDEEDFRITGKHANYWKDLCVLAGNVPDRDQHNNFKIFNAYIDAYIVCPIIGYQFNRKGTIDNSI